MQILMVGASTPSHVYPGLALMRELTARGHRLTYAVADRLADLVAPTSARVFAHRTALPNADVAWPDDVGEAMHLFLVDAIAVLPRLLSEVPRPDVVLYDIGGLAGRVAAHRWGVPAVQVSPTYVAWEGYEQDMAEHTRALKATVGYRRYESALRGWLDDNGMTIGADAFLGRPPACVVLIPRVLQMHSCRVSSRYAFTGPCLDMSRMTGWRPVAGDERPLAYVAFGTSYTDRADVYAACIEALACEYRVVLATGKVDPAVLGRLPDGVWAARTQPQLDVLAHASVFITHAGMGSAVEALWFGVPAVAIPQAADQFANAAQLELIGAGVQLVAEEVTVGAIRDRVVAAVACSSRARELRDDVRKHGGAAACADAVERFAWTGLS